MDAIKKIFGWLVTLLVPVVLVLLAIRILLTPVFYQIEYRLPYFPDDPYQFTREERLHWAGLSVKYLLNREGIEFLADLQFPDGQQAAGSCEDYFPPRDCTYLYNDRELQHMVDVKVVVRYAMAALWGSIAILLGLAIWSKRSDWWPEYKWALARGGWFTAGLIVAMLVYLVLNFDSLFVKFHQIFFEANTWRFLYSDSLIRLFPEIFWRDVFIWVGVMALGGGVALGVFFGRKDKGKIEPDTTGQE